MTSAVPAISVRAPGRVNLIGEHTDYQEGLVLPFALDLALVMTVQPRADGVVRLRSTMVPGLAEFGPADDPAWISPVFAKYLAAVRLLLQDAGLNTPGFDGEISGDLPVGAGLSSSAALCVATVLASLALAEAAGEAVPEELRDPVRLADLCRRAEGLAAGVRCGLMDPLVILAATTGTALLINCRAETWRPILIDAGRFAFILADSCVRRTLGDGEYNLRREECEEAVDLVRASGLDLFTLRDLAPADLPRAREILPDVLYRRVRHVVTENARVRVAADALRDNDVEALGASLNASHDSLRDDFEVSCPELDALVKAARAVPGVLGCRMTGAGFGGMVIAAVRPSAVRDLLAALPSAAEPRLVTPGGPAESGGNGSCGK